VVEIRRLERTRVLSEYGRISGDDVDDVVGIRHFVVQRIKKPIALQRTAQVGAQLYTLEGR
jgi:hypothetical protein